MHGTSKGTGLHVNACGRSDYGKEKHRKKQEKKKDKTFAEPCRLNRRVLLSVLHIYHSPPLLNPTSYATAAIIGPFVCLIASADPCGPSNTINPANVGARCVWRISLPLWFGDAPESNIAA